MGLAGKRENVLSKETVRVILALLSLFKLTVLCEMVGVCLFVFGFQVMVHRTLTFGCFDFYT